MIRQDSYDDRGLTLIELLVVIAVSSLFLGLLAVMFGNAWGEQGRSSARDRATGYTNVISASLSSIRNATQATSSADGKTIIASIVSKADGEQRCYGWSVRDNGIVRYRGAASTPIRFSDADSWGKLVDLRSADFVSGRFAASEGDVVVDLVVRAPDVRIPLAMTIPAQAVLETEVLQCVAP